jgi:hypothetical protein
MKITNYEIITVRKKLKDFTPKVPLVTKEGELTEDALTLFNSWFTKLSSPDGVMYPHDSVRFLKFVQGNPYDYLNENNPTLRNFFAKYDPEGHGYVTREAFISFYKERSGETPETVWKNITHAGYGHDLKPIDGDSAEDPKESRDPNQNPRYFVAQDPELYQRLVALLPSLPTNA